DVNGSSPIPNGHFSIAIGTSSNNTIGGTTASARNVISGSGGALYIENSTGNSVLGNYIGTDRTGTLPLGNLYGIYIQNGYNNVIGGTSAGAANLIAYNDHQACCGAVYVDSGTGNMIRGNSMYSNSPLGIDLKPEGIVNPNDLDDSDAGANDMQNYPD